MVNIDLTKARLAVVYVYPDGGAVVLPRIIGGKKDSSAPPPPEPTAEEQEIQQLVLGQLRSGSEMQEMLMPYMMEEMGYRVVDTERVIPGAAGTELTSAEQNELERLRADVATRPEQVVQTLSERRRIAELEAKVSTPVPESTVMERSIVRISPEERLAGMDPQERKAYELHDAYLERQLSAVRGELPVSPALERDISERRGLLRTDLSRRLGPQYRQSTAGLQTEAKFEESADIAKEKARQDIIAQGPGLIGSSQAGMEGGKQTRQAGLYSVPQTYYAGMGAGQQALQPYQQQRGLLHQSQMQSAANRAQQTAGLYGLAGTGLGAYATYAGLAASSKEYKEDIEMVGDGEADEVLDMVRDGNTYTYKYKKGLGQPKGKRIGLVTEDAPREVVSPNGKMLDMPQELGLLRTAIKALAKKEKRRERRA